RVGCSACGERTLVSVRQRYDEGHIDTLIESKRNINKDPMMRLLVEAAEAPYVLWFDDDTHVEPGWDRLMGEFIRDSEPFDCAGHVFYCHRSEEYKTFLHKRPWWGGEEAYREPDHRKRVWFATGGLQLIRTEYLRRHNFPDRCMRKRADDLLLGDMISQTGGILVNFPPAIMASIHISDGGRRGDGEGLGDWLEVDPRTGF
ncbi:MAG TPA: hypothetical protein VFC78_13835, partial [Tepidisphaeraceae bacterium]|nr:hypothetical protein [Tepidisphaeraceae bacterium]